MRLATSLFIVAVLTTACASESPRHDARSGPDGGELLPDAGGWVDGEGGLRGDGGVDCLPAVVTDLQLDRDLRVVAVSGVLTVNGGQMPASPTAKRGTLSFIEKGSGGVVVVPVGPSGEAAFATPLYAGVYDVQFTSETSSALVGLPVGLGTVLASDLRIDDTQVFAWDLPVVRLSGTFTVNGGQMPNSSANRGRAQVSSSGGLGTVSVDVGPSGPASFSTLLFAGSYDVAFASGSSPSLVGLPIGAKTVVADELRVDADRSLTWNLPVVTASGTLTLNGGQLPSSPVSRGQLTFTEASSQDSVTTTIAGSGEATFSRLLFGGRYEVTFDSANSTSLVGLPIAQRVRLAQGVVLNASQDFRWDLPVVTVSGTLTVNGGQMPASPSNAQRGALLFSAGEVTSTANVPIGASGAASFSTLLFAGSYDVDYAPPRSTRVPGIPEEGRARLAEDLVVRSPGSFAWNVPVVTLSGKLTRNGDELPASPGVRGRLHFINLANGATESSVIEAQGPASFSRLLFGGRYDVRFSSSDDAALTGLPRNATTSVAEGVQLLESRSHVWDLRVVTASGTLTVNGGQMPASSVVRGQVRFTDARSGGVTWMPVGASGPARYGSFLFGGNHNVDFVTAGGGGLVGLPVGTVTRLESGCR